MQEQVYVVPELIAFKNWQFFNGSQTRNLLLKNNTPQRLPAFVSYPFTAYFAVHAASSDGQHSLHSSPPHYALQLEPNSATKVVVELRLPSTAAAAAEEGESQTPDNLQGRGGGGC